MSILDRQLSIFMPSLFSVVCLAKGGIDDAASEQAQGDVP